MTTKSDVDVDVDIRKVLMCTEYGFLPVHTDSTDFWLWREAKIMPVTIGSRNFVRTSE